MRRLAALLAPLALTAVLAGPALAAAPDKKPADFRGVLWGAPTASLTDFKAIDRDGDIIHGERSAEKKELGGITLKSVTYSFFKDQFYHAEIGYDAPGAFDALRQGLVAKYGEPDAVRRKTDASGKAYEVTTWNWPGAVFIGLRQDVGANSGRVFYFYAPLTEASAKTQPSLGQTAAPAGPATGEATYHVQKGDSMERIAKRQGTSLEALSAANGGLTDKGLKAGATIKLPGQTAKASKKPASPPPPGQYMEYTVKEGEILSKVANAHGARSRDVIAANPDIEPDNIRPGTVLRIPVKKDAPKPEQKGEEVEVVAPPGQ
jgi:LysM repeat protein